MNITTIFDSKMLFRAAPNRLLVLIHVVFRTLASIINHLTAM